MAEVEKDEQFYMNLVTIQVENSLFRVPRQALEFQSKIFRDMFSPPKAENADGSSDENPIRFEGIRKGEFKRFLEVLFMGYCEETTKSADSVFDAWFPVLKLARKWECNGICKHAIKKIPYALVRKSPAEKLALAVKHDIKSWLLPGVNELARREGPLDTSDLEHLGPELTLKVATVRESLTLATDEDGYAILASGTRNTSEVDFMSVIKHTFNIPDHDVDDETPEANAKPKIRARPRICAKL